MDNKIAQELRDAYEEGSFLGFVYNEYYRGSKSELILELCKAHENKEINFFDELLTLNRENECFFPYHQIIEEITISLEHIDCRELFLCSNHLYKEAGEDLASHYFMEPFMNNVHKDLAGLDALIEDLALREDISQLLIAGARTDVTKYFEKAKVLLREKSNYQYKVIFALNRMELSDDQANEVLNIFKDLLNADGLGEHSHVTMLHAIVKLHSVNKVPEEETLGLIDRLSKMDDDVFIHEATTILALFFKEISPNIEKKLLDLVIKVTLDNKGTLNQIGFYLFKLANKYPLEDHINEALDLIQKLNQNKRTVLNIGENLQGLKSFVSQLSNDIKKTNYFITKLFLMRDFSLIASFINAWSDIFHRNKNISVESTLIDECEFEYPALYLAKKAYSWFCFYYESMTYYIFSLIPYVKKSEEKEFIEILKQLSISYPSVFDRVYQEYFEDKKEVDWVRSVKDKKDTYFQQINGLGTIKELKTPSENQDYRNMIFQDMLKQGYNASMNNSPFLQLISRQTILYGRGTISHNQDQYRSEDLLHPMSTKNYMSNLWFLDPHTNQYLIFKYKTEDCMEDEVCD